MSETVKVLDNASQTNKTFYGTTILEQGDKFKYIQVTSNYPSQSLTLKPDQFNDTLQIKASKTRIGGNWIDVFTTPDGNNDILHDVIALRHLSFDEAYALNKGLSDNYESPESKWIIDVDNDALVRKLMKIDEMGHVYIDNANSIAIGLPYYDINENPITAADLVNPTISGAWLGEGGVTITLPQFELDSQNKINKVTLHAFSLPRLLNEDNTVYIDPVWTSWDTTTEGEITE